MAAAICLAYHRQTSSEATMAAEPPADEAAGSSLRRVAQAEQQERAERYLKKLWQYAENAHQQAAGVLKQEVLKQGASLQPGDTLQAAIGQSDTLCTPLQLAGQKLGAIRKQVVSDVEKRQGFEALKQLLSLKYDENSVHILKE